MANKRLILSFYEIFLYYQTQTQDNLYFLKVKKLSHDRKNCLECAGCIGVCPTMALDMFGLDLQINHDKCNRCGICVRACPAGVLNWIEKPDEK